jgi:hypothetical protein
MGAKAFKLPVHRTRKPLHLLRHSRLALLGLNLSRVAKECLSYVLYLPVVLPGSRQIIQGGDWLKLVDRKDCIDSVLERIDELKKAGSCKLGVGLISIICTRLGTKVRNTFRP